MLKKDLVYETLRDKIVRLEYKPGLILNEADLASDLGVSRTPIRDAMQRLERDKLVIIAPRYGAQIPQIDFIGMKSLFDLTKVLDSYASESACANATEDDIKELQLIVDRLREYDMETQYQEAIVDDEKFHLKIRQLANNRWLDESLSYLHLHSERLWHYCKDFFDGPEIFHDTLQPIVDAMKNEDPDAAAKAAEIHIDSFVEKIKNTLL